METILFTLIIISQCLIAVWLTIVEKELKITKVSIGLLGAMAFDKDVNKELNKKFKQFKKDFDKKGEK